MTDTRLRPVVNTDTGDHDLFAHYVIGYDPESMVLAAMVEGTPLLALCGKVLVPSRDASKLPVCPECKERRAELLGGV